MAPRVFLLLLLAGACRGPADGATPVDGHWHAGLLAFQVQDGTVLGLDLHGVGCSGPLTAAGEPTCEAPLVGQASVTAPIRPDGGFHLETVFGLTVEGRFLASDRAEGSWSFVAPSGCCSASGTFTAHPGGGDEAEPCTPPTGEETLRVGLTAGHEGPSPRFVRAGPAVEVVPGFQGAVMVVAAIQATGLIRGPFTLDVSVRFPATAVAGHTRRPDARLDEDQWGLVSMFVVLEHPDKGVLVPGNPEDLALIDGQGVELTATVTSPCGLHISAAASGVARYRDR